MSNHGSVFERLDLYDLDFLVACGLLPTGTKKMMIMASMMKNIVIIDVFGCTNITNFRDIRKSRRKKMQVKKLVFSSGFLMRNSRFLEIFTDFQTSKS